MKTTIIGHRGAAGPAIENTIASFERAIELGANAIELDVRKTVDDVLVVCHDRDIDRIAESNLVVSKTKWRDLQKITLKDGKSYIPTLDKVLKVIGTTPVFIEIKALGCAKLLIHVLDKYPEAKATVISFKLGELLEIRHERPKIPIYLNEQTKAIEAIQAARALKLNGVGLNFWLLNPLAYSLARRAKLKIFVYTVNRRFYGRLIHLLYPKVSICTDHPEYFVSRRRRKR